MIDFFTPQDGPYDCSKALSPPQLYWSSPSGSTASIPVSRAAVLFALQSVAVPLPLLYAGAAGSQAMSPAAPMTGSGFGWTCAVCVCTASVLPTLSTEKNLKVAVWLMVKGRPSQAGLDVVGVEPSVV